MPKIQHEFKSYIYENYEEYLSHAADMTKDGWKFSSQHNDHKEVTWVKFYESQ
jgi:hypothetical protein